MYALPKMETAIGIRAGRIVELIIRTKFSDKIPTYIKEYCQKEMLLEIIKLIEISENYKSTFYADGPSRIQLQKGEMVISSALLFKDDKSMNAFLNSIKK